MVFGVLEFSLEMLHAKHMLSEFLHVLAMHILALHKIWSQREVIIMVLILSSLLLL